MGASLFGVQFKPSKATGFQSACYCMCMLERRLQILLDRDRYERVAREAIDRAFPSTSRRRQQAADRILQAPDTPAPDVGELKRELDELRGGGR